MAQLTQSGLVIESLSAILERKKDKAITLSASLLPEGEVLTTDSSSIVGRLLQVSSEIDYLQEEVLQELYASINPNSAEKKDLDKIVQLKDIKRKLASMGTAQLVLYGDISVTVGYSSIVASKSTSDQFSLDSSVTFTNVNSAGVEFDITNPEIEGEITLSYTLNNDLNSNVPIKIKYAGGQTKEMVAGFIKTNIENITTKLKITITNEFNIQVRPNVDGLTGDFYITGTGAIVRSFMPVNATSLYNVPEQEAHSITTIQSSTYGWRGVDNLFKTIASKEIEQDGELRQRFYKATGSLATGHISAMYTALHAIAGVTYVKITENQFDQNTQDGRSAHGFAVIIYGGSDEEIASAIEKTRPLGVPMDGTVKVAVNNYYNHTSTIKFSRPKRVGIKIKASLDIFEEFPPSGVIDIKNAVVDYFNTLEFGEDVILSRLYIPFQVVNGIGIKDIQIAKVGEDFGTSNIEIFYDEIATVAFDDITI